MLPKVCLYLKQQLQSAVPSCLTLGRGQTHPFKVPRQGFYCRFTLQSLPVSGHRPRDMKFPLCFLVSFAAIVPLLSSYPWLHILTDPLALPLSGSNPSLCLLLTLELTEFSCNCIFISSKGCEGKDLGFFCSPSHFEYLTWSLAHTWLSINMQ